MHFRILKMIATSRFLIAVECTKFVFGRGFEPDSAGGVYSSPQTSTLVYGSPTSKGRGENGKIERGGRKKKSKRGRKGRGGKKHPFFINSCLRPCQQQTAVHCKTCLPCFRTLVCLLVRLSVSIVTQKVVDAFS